MSVEVTGAGGAGSVLVYSLPSGYVATLETLSFKVVTDATAGTHAIRLVVTSPTGAVVARLDDLNAGGASQTNFYTYGIGLNASACTITTGMAVTDALPWTTLVPGTTLTLTAINAAGATIAGDLISDVLIHFDRGVDAQPQDTQLPLTLLPGALAA